MKKIIALLTVLTMILSSMVAVMADTISGEGPVPQNVKVIPYEDKLSFGISYWIQNPETAPETSTITLYDASDDSIAGAEKDIAYKTAGGWGKTQFKGLDSTKSYYAVIKMSDGTNIGTYTTDAYTPGWQDFEGFKFGRLTGVDHLAGNTKERYRHSLSTYTIDSNEFYEGTSSLKIDTYGWDGDEGWEQTQDTSDKFDTIVFGGIKIDSPQEGDYYEYKVAYKGHELIYGSNFAGITMSASSGMTEISVSSQKINGWTVVTKVMQASATTASKGVIPNIQIKMKQNRTIRIDSVSVRKISDYNTVDGTYSQVGENVVLGGGFDTSIKNLHMYSQRELSWELPQNAMFYALNIYKDDNAEPIGTINYSDYSGVSATSYTIPAESWDESSTYTVKAIPAVCANAQNNQAPNSCGKEGPGVSVTGVTTIDIVSYDGQPATELWSNGIDGYVDISWVVPSGNILQTKVELIDSDDDVVKTTYKCTYDSIYGVASFSDVDTTKVYKARVTTVYDNFKAGVAEVENVIAVPTRDLDGLCLGGWFYESNGSTYREIYKIAYDSDVYKTGHGSVRIDLRGFVSADGTTFRDSAPGSNYAQFTNYVGRLDSSKYYELSYTYKEPIKNVPKADADTSGRLSFRGGKTAGTKVGRTDDYMTMVGGEKTISETDSNGWTTTRAIYKPAADDTRLYVGAYIEGCSRRICYIDSFTVREVSYNTEDYSYEVTGENLVAGGELKLDVENATIDGDGIIQWTEPDSRIIDKVLIYDLEGTLIDEIDADTCFAVVDDLEKQYILKVRTKGRDDAVSTVLTSGVNVVNIAGQAYEVSEISLIKRENFAEASVTARNISLNSLNLTLMLVFYDKVSGKLTNIISDSTILNKGSNEELLHIQTTVPETDNVKAMLWDLSTMKPFAASKQ